METANRTAINQSLNRDDMVNLVPFGAVGIDLQKSAFANPRRCAAFNVFSAEIQSRRIVGIVRPPFAPRLINSLLAFVVSGLFLTGESFAVGSVPEVFGASPIVLVVGIAPEVLGRSSATVGVRTGLAAVTDGIELPIELGTRFFDTAAGADLGRNRLSGHRDIIAIKVGDVKQRELREQRATPIRSQAAQEWAEGSETRAWSPDRTVKPHERGASLMRMKR